MLSRRVARVLIATALILLIALLVAVFVVGGLAWLLGAMGDTSGQAALGGVALALGILAVIDLVLLVVAVGFHCLEERDRPPDGPS